MGDHYGNTRYLIAPRSARRCVMLREPSANEPRECAVLLSSILYGAFGVTWAGRSLLEVAAHPAYWEPRTALDWIAVWSFSLGFGLLAPAVILLARDVRAGRLAGIIGGGVAIAALLAAIGNAVEDGAGVSAFGTAYVVGALGSLFGLIVLAAVLASRGRRRDAGVATLWALGLALVTFGLGIFVLAGSVLAVDARRRVATVA